MPFWKIGSFGGCADDDAVALDDSKDREESFRSRAGPYAGGESPATALAAPPDPITLFAPHAANSRRSQARPVSRRTTRDATTVWLRRRDCSRRDTRQWVKRLGSDPIGGGTDSPLTHQAARYRNDCSPLPGSRLAAAVIVSTYADEPFFRGVEPERRRSHTVVASRQLRRRLRESQYCWRLQM